MFEGLVTDTVAVGARTPDADEEGVEEAVLLLVTDAEGRVDVLDAGGAWAEGLAFATPHPANTTPDIPMMLSPTAYFFHKTSCIDEPPVGYRLLAVSL